MNDPEAHAVAVKTLLALLPGTLYDGQVPGNLTSAGDFPYSVLFMDTGDDTSDRVCNDANVADYRFQITSVGLDAGAARIRCRLARDLLVDKRPVVASRSCTRIKRETSIPVRPDTDVTVTEANLHPMFAVDTYHFVSYAA